METIIDLSIECCKTCKHWTWEGGDTWGRCEKNDEETNMHSGCDEYEPM